MSDKTPFQQDIDSKARALKESVEFVFGRSYSAKSTGVSPLAFEVWLNQNDMHEPEMIWDKPNHRMLIRYMDGEDNTRTRVMSELLELIEKEQ